MRKGVYYPVSFSKHAKSKSCNNGEYSCTPPKECCNFKLGCCNPHSPQHVFFWSHWYFWCSMFFVLVVFCVCGCGMWRRGRVRRPSDPRTPSSMPRASSYTSWCQPPQYSRCSSFLLPPPYSEVTAKPELYPLVLSYNMDGNKITNGSYYVVQQFRNYLINPLSSLSGTSNEEALGSNLLDDTISDTNPAPPSYTLVPDNSVIIQNEVQTSTSLLDNLTQSIPEEEGEQNAEEEEDKTTESETAPLNPPGSQLFAHFNSNVSRFSSKHKRYSSIIVTPNQSTQSIRRSYSAPPTPSTSILPNFPSSHSGNATSENPAPLFVPPVCTVISEQPVAGAFFVPPVIPEQPVDTSSQCDVTSEHPVPKRQEHPMPQCNIISVLPVGSAICEHPVVDL